MAAPPLTSLTGAVLSKQLNVYYDAASTTTGKSADAVLNIAGLSYLTIAQAPGTTAATTVQFAAWKAVADAVTANVTIPASSTTTAASTSALLRRIENAVDDVVSRAAVTMMGAQATATLGALSRAQAAHVQAKMAAVFAAVDALTPVTSDTHTAFLSKAQAVAPLRYDGDVETVLTAPLLEYAKKLVVPYAHARFLLAYATPASSLRPTFYDQRVARWLLLDALIRGVGALSTDAPAVTGLPATDATYVTNMSTTTLRSLLTDLKKARDAEYALAGTGGADSPLFKLYDGTAKASASARASTAALEPIHSAASARATRIASLQWNVAQAEAAARRARLVLVAWIVALFVALAVAVVLIVRASPAAVYAYAATVIVTVLALGVATLALRWRAASRLDGAVLY